MSGFLYRLGRLTARHRFVVLLAWIALAATVIITVSRVGARTNNDLTLPGTGSQEAFDVLAKRFPPQQNGASPIVFSVDRGKLTDERNKRAIDRSFKAIERAPHVYSATNPVSKDGQTAGLLSDDQRIGFIPVLLDVGSGALNEEIANRVLAGAESARRVGIQVAAGGPIGSELSTPDTEMSERIGIIAAMIILSLVFGSLVAMGMPIITAVIGLSIALALIGLLGHLLNIPTVGATLATMIGLGVGIDYSLFLVTRHKDQIGQGMEIKESIAQAVSTSGSAIVFAGGTVVIALASLAVAGIPLVSSLGYSSAVAVLTAVLGAVTLLPALLSIIGTRIHWLSVPKFLRPTPKPPGHGRWAGWARWIARRPLLAVALALLILIPLAIPLLSLQLGQEDIGVTPKSTTERQAYDMMTAGFGVGYNGPLLIATELDPVAQPSASFERRFRKAKKLERELKREQRVLDRRQAKLERRQAELERERDQLQAEGAELEEERDQLQAEGAELAAEGADLERERSQLEAEQDRIRNEAARLEARARPLLERLALILVRERILEERIEQATDPNLIARLKRRLARVRARESQVRKQLAPLERQAINLARQEEALLSEASRLAIEAQELESQEDLLRAQGEELQQQAALLRQQGDELKRQGDQLKRDAAQLKREARRAKKQEREAKKLKRELTNELTKAGGDRRGTDPRIVSLQDGLAGAGDVDVVSPPQINKAGDAAVMNVIAHTSPSSEQTADVVVHLRSSVIPKATSDAGITAYVGGFTASYVDLATKIAEKLPLVIVVVISLSFVLLLLAFRSLVIPFQAAVTNLLCVAAAFGVLTATFQWGWGVDLIGLDSPSGTVPIASYVPLMMFAVLFGLSMDYEVFLMSQIQQHHAEGKTPREAIPAGLASSARVITAAALIMISVFGSFILNGDPTVKQFGVGLATAVALAAAMVILLAPAVLILFGRAVWWLPRFLDRILPHVSLEGEGPAKPGASTPTKKEQPTPAGAPPGGA